MSPAGAISELLRENVDLGEMTTYRSGGPARLFAEIRDRGDLHALIASGATQDVDLLVLGRGSNLVVSDDGFDGMVIKLGGEFTTIDVEGLEVFAGGAAPLPRVARTAVEQGVLGLEFLVGVPGSVGGAVRQNAGCFGMEVVDCLVGATIVDLRTGETGVRGPAELGFGYRQSNVRPTEIVVGAKFMGRSGDTGAGRARMREITRWRRDHQPGGTFNAGSVFKNPSDISAGELIDKLGLKGTRVGDVAVSDKHANFFVAGPAATSAQIKELVEVVKDAVFEKSGTKLMTEIQFVGFD